MTAHEIDNMVSEINEKDIAVNTKKATKFGSGVFQGTVLVLNIILRLNFTREAAEKPTSARVDVFF